MSLSTKPYKGARDFYPEDKRLQKYMFGVMRKVVESFGYEEYDAPILEPTDLYLIKGNQEIIEDQTYTFEDRGGRSVTLRTEMTPTVSRMVAGRRQELAYPLRWYSIPNLWRYERMQRGRTREFWQLNVDIFGVEGKTAELEIIQVADSIMKAYGAKSSMYTIKLNSRVLINYVLEQYIGLDTVQASSMIGLIDRMNKLERKEFEAQVHAVCTPAQREEGKAERLLALLTLDSVDQLPDDLRDAPSVQRLSSLLEALYSRGITNAVFDMSLMRGFDYYTDIVFEVFDMHPDNKRAMFGGGRYDGLVSQFGVDAVPTVGFGMGDVTLQNFLESHDLLPQLAPETDVYIALVGDVYERAANFLSQLRSQGLNVAVDISGRKLDKQLKAASKKSIRYVIVLGEKELDNERFILRDITDGSEEEHGVERIISTVLDYRRRDSSTSV